MDINDLRIAVTVASFALFMALTFYAWSRRRHAEYEAAEQLPFVEDLPVTAVRQGEAP